MSGDVTSKKAALVNEQHSLLEFPTTSRAAGVSLQGGERKLDRSPRMTHWYLPKTTLSWIVTWNEIRNRRVDKEKGNKQPLVVGMERSAGRVRM
jgi:hypothetical protein